MIEYSTDESSEESALLHECDERMRYTAQKEMFYVDIVNTIFNNIQTKKEILLLLLPIIYLCLQLAALLLMYSHNVKYASIMLYLSYIVFIYINVCLYTLINQRLNVPELTHMHIINISLLLCSMCIVITYVVIHYQLQPNYDHVMLSKLSSCVYYYLYVCIVLVYISISFTLHKIILCYYNVTKLCLITGIFIVSLLHISMYLSKLYYHYDTCAVDRYMCVSLYLLFALFVFDLRKDLMFISQSLRVKSDVEFFVDVEEEDNTL